ncbi:MAG: hypothetical protein K8U57_00055 [Planctomycetes bacterium]|nr:hypothetical protein [Planctomycetota bacterium]
MNTEPPQITLWHRSNVKHSRWRLIGTVDGYGAAITLGERAGLRGGKWWLSDRNNATEENSNDNQDIAKDAA